MDQATKEKLEEFLHRKEILKELRRLAAAGQKSLVVEFEQLLEFDMGLAKALLDGPNDFLDAADAILTETTKLPGMHLRVKGLDKTTAIRDIRAGHVGKFIQVEGIMTRASEVKPEIKEAVFKCLRCGEVTRVMQIDEVFREPLVCENPNCLRRGPFKLEVESSEFRDWQSIRIQERPEELRGGRMPRQLDCIIKDDFVDKAVPGNRIVASGVLRVFQEGVPKQRKTTFRKILFINHIEVMQKGIEETELSPEDEARIKELGKDPWLRNLIIQSIAPSIYGYEAVKEGIALQLFGCSPVELPDGTRIRGDTHILLTGDPGTAKSEILKWVSQVAPRGLYTSGKKATGAGLCVAPDSLIWVSNGLIPISDLVENHFGGRPVSEITAVNVEAIPQFGDGANAITSLWKIPAPQKMVEILTQYGNKIEVTPETRVMTEKGWKKAKELTIGDRVILPMNYGGWSSPYPSIVHFYPKTLKIKNRAEIFEKFSSKIKNKRALANALGIPEDKMYCEWLHDDVRGAMTLEELRKLCSYLKVDVDEILDGIELKSQLRPGIYFKLPTKLSPQLAYFVGLIAGDGSLSERKGENSMVVRFSNNDLKREYVRLVRDLFGKEVEVSPPSEKCAQDFRFGNRAVFELLRGLGIKKPKELFIPREILCSRELAAAYLCGLFDTGGSVYDGRKHGDGRRGRIEITTIYRNFAEQVQNVLFRFGIPAYLTERRPRKAVKRDGNLIESKKQYRISITQNAAIDRFAKVIGFSVRRKREKLKEIVGRKKFHRYAKYVPAKIKEIRIVPSRYQYVYDMTVEGSHSFIANGFLVHNTATAVRDEIGGGWTLEAGALVIADGGLCCIDEFDKMCLKGNSVVYLGDGRIEKIEEVFRGLAKENQVTAKDGYEMIETKIPVFTSVGGKIVLGVARAVTRRFTKEPLFSLKLRSGKTLTATGNHPILTLDANGYLKYKRLREIRPGEAIACPRKLPTPQSPFVAPSAIANVQADDEFGMFFGYLASEGSVSVNPSYGVYKVDFHTHSQQLNDHYARIAERLGLKVRTPPSSMPQNRRINSKKFVTELLGIWPSLKRGARNKNVPACIMRASNDVVASFLSAFIEGDGGVYKNPRSICFFSSSETMIKQIQGLLLRFEVLSRITKSCKPGYAPCYRLVIQGESAVRLAEHLRLVSEGKIKHLQDNLIASRNKRRMESLDTVPSVGPLIRKIRKSLGLYCHQLGLNRSTVSLFERGICNPSRGSLQKIIQAFEERLSRNPAVKTEIEHLKMLVDSDLFFDVATEVKMMENEGTYVYNLSVDGVRNFIADGIIVHNSDEDRSAILESLEQQTISVAKAGIVATLNTRTSVLAAANPKGGRFDRQRLISEQIDLPPVILSRFDLIFVMRDEPLAERDRTIAHHMLELHREPTRVVKPPLDVDTLRKLIIYSRKNIDPKFEDEEVLKTIENFYVKWRSVAESGEAPVPITPRQLEALIRLAKANARMRLSDRVTVEDANRAIKLVSFYLREAGVDTETGKIDIDVLMTGRSRSQREKLQRVLDIIRELESEYGGAAPVEQIKRMAETDGISASFVERMIEEELRRGHLYEPKQGMVSRTVK